MNVLRIAVLSYRLPVAGQKRGGIERVAHGLADGLGRRGHEVTVFSHDPAPTGAAYRVMPLPWREFVDTWLGRRLTMGYLGNVLMLLPPLAGADVVITPGDSLLLPLKRVPFVRVMTGSAWSEARSATSIGRLVLQTGVFLQELACAALHPATVGISHNTRRSNPFVRHVIELGVDLRTFTAGPAERSPDPSLVFVGALGGRKRGAWLLDRFVNEIAQRFPRCTIDMVCEPGPEVKGVRYRVGVSDAELARLYRRAWLYVSPSTYEGFGLPYVEAMACGTPVVASPNPGSSEVLDHGRWGVLADDNDFAGAVCDLLADAGARARLEQLALERSHAYDGEAMIAAYERLLYSLAIRGRQQDTVPGTRCT
jgi:phosphatidyl-myo-inositol alpha-mannosyltransferase